MSIHPIAKDTDVLDILIKHYVPDLRLANQCSWSERGCCLSQPIPNDWHLLHKYHTYKRMASKIRIDRLWLERGCCFSQPTPHERKRGYSLSQPYKHIIPLIWGYVNPLYDIFLFNQQLILLPSYLHHK